MLHTLSLLLVVLFATGARAEAMDTDAAYANAHRAFQTARYAAAVDILKVAIKARPDCARCVHLLGKSYGRLAEQASWFSAVDLARKARNALEHAVELAPHNVDAIDDLARYYREAPAFLGGSSDKARALEQQRQQLGSGAAD